MGLNALWLVPENINGKHILTMAGTYRGHQAPPLPLASPLYATLHQLSPMMIQVRSREPFYSQVTEFSRRVRTNGGTVLLDEWDELPHLWQYFSSVFQPGREAIERIGLFIREKILSTTFSNTSTGSLGRGPLFGGD